MEDYVSKTFSFDLHFQVDRGNEDLLQRLDGKYERGTMSYEAYRLLGYLSLSGKVARVHQHVMHRAGVVVPNGYSIDHINGDPGDNRRCNLRVATRQEQQANTRPQGRHNSTNTATERHYHIDLTYIFDADNVDILERIDRICRTPYAIDRVHAGAGKLRHTDALHNSQFSLAQYVMYRRYGLPESGTSIDHIDNDPGNNRYYNLRVATYKEQSSNRRVAAEKVSDYYGVRWDSGRQSWGYLISTGTCGINGTRKWYGGGRKDWVEIDAAVAYDLRVRELGVDNNRNFTDEQLINMGITVGA